MGSGNEGLIRLHPEDNVAVLIRSVGAGDALRIDGEPLVCPKDLPLGHKLATRAIAAGEKILKYGAPIGSATRNIGRGEHVHLQNIKSDYIPTQMSKAQEEAAHG
jgi:hypothetical protein